MTEMDDLYAERNELLATIERVEVLVAPWITIKDVQETHSDKCYTWHPDCLVSAIRDALEEQP